MPTTRTMALVLACATSGCSLFVMRAPAGDPPRCLSTRVPPVIDTIEASGAVVLGLALAEGGDSSSSSSGGIEIDEGFATGLALAMAVPFAVSAWYGFDRAAMCRRTKDALAVRSRR
jgi:hypothetical protein